MNKYGCQQAMHVGCALWGDKTPYKYNRLQMDPGFGGDNSEPMLELCKLFTYFCSFFLSFFQFAPYIYLFVTFVLSSRTHNSTQLTQSFASLPIISLYCTSLYLTLPYYLRMRIHITMINKLKSLQSTCTRIRRRI